MQVVDASCLYEVIVDGPRAEAVSVAFASDPDLVAPHLIDVEVMGVIRKATTERRLDSTAGRLATVSLASWPGERFGHQPLLARVWELRANVRTQDAVYVALAEVLGATLVTLDARMAKAPGIRCEVLVPELG